MINKLRMKFVLVAMIAITIVTIAIFGMIQIDNHVRTNRQIDEIINIIIENNGTIPKKDFSNRTNPYINQETRYTTRYFTATLDDDNEILNIDMDNISSVSEDEANKIINNIIKKSKISGNIENFRYKYSKDEKIIVVIDCTAQIINQKQFTQKANIIIIAGLFVTFVIIYILSTKAIEPTVNAINKQKEFISNAGHDLKTPVSIILADVEVLKMQDNIKDNEFIESIKNQSHKLNELINSLLNLAKLDEISNKLSLRKDGEIEEKLEITKFSFTKLVKDEIEEMKPLLNEINMECNLDFDVEIEADKNKIKQLITILLDNSIKYVDENGIIKVDVSKQGKYVRFEISNTYKNVKNIDTKKIFDRFYREDKSRNSKKGGHGIGLSMAKTIVNMHKGKIYASSKNNNEKIVFIVLLPMNNA